MITKKLLSLALAGAVAVVFSSSVSALSTEDEIRTQVEQYYENNPMYNAMYDANPTIAEKYIDDVVNQKIENLSLQSQRASSNNQSIVFSYVTHVTQSTQTNCSAATTLQTMYGLGLEDNIYGSTNAVKQATLYNMRSNSLIDDPYEAYNLTVYSGLRMTPGTGTPTVYEVTTYLSDWLEEENKGHIYDYTVGSDYTFDDFVSKIGNSLYFDRPVLLHARTEFFNYYSGNALSHYLSLDLYNAVTGTVRIVDCNYNSSYGGIHNNVPINEAYRSIHEVSERYLIAAVF